MSDETLKLDGLVLIPISLIKLILELDPVQSQRMQEAFHGIHAHQHSEGHPHQNVE